MDFKNNLSIIPSDANIENECNLMNRQGKEELLTLCCICGKTFSGVISLRDHFKTCHDSNICDSSVYEPGVQEFTNNAEKTVNPKPYKCEYCLKCFTKSCNLRSHVKAVHKGVKSHECTVCRKFFTRNSDLQKHVDAVHKRLRPFKCKVCTRTFSQKSSLKRHLEAVHDNSRKNKHIGTASMMIRVDENCEEKQTKAAVNTNNPTTLCSSDVSNGSSSPIDMSPTPISSDIAISNVQQNQGIDPALLIDVLRNILQRNPAALEYFKQQLSASLLSQSFPTPLMPNEFEFDAPSVGGGEENKLHLPERFNETPSIQDFQQNPCWMQLLFQSARPSPLDYFINHDPR